MIAGNALVFLYSIYVYPAGIEKSKQGNKPIACDIGKLWAIRVYKIKNFDRQYVILDCVQSQSCCVQSQNIASLIQII